MRHLFPAPEALAAAAAMRWASWASCASGRRRSSRSGGPSQGRLALHAGADVPATVAALKELPGIGDWTAQYIAMRALRWPDAFPAGDVALHKALGVQLSRQPARGRGRVAGLEAVAQLRGGARVERAVTRSLR